MKKQILLLFFINICLLSNSQPGIATAGRCTDEMAATAKGRWLKTADVSSALSSTEITARLGKIHEMVVEIIPQPAGVDAAWHRSAGKSQFGEKRKYARTDDGRTDYNSSNLPHFSQYYFRAGFFGYRCEYGKSNSLVPGYPGETGTWLTIFANGNLGTEVGDDTWTIDGLPVMQYYSVKERKEGIEFLFYEPDSRNRFILIHRKGVLPYKHVTRKQYLDHCIIRYANTFDEAIKGVEQFPVRSLEEQEREKQAKIEKFKKQFANDPQKLKANVDYYLSGYKTDQQKRDENILIYKTKKEQELKKWTDELEKTKSEGLLDSPAMVRVNFRTEPIFETNPALGTMFITENPDYIRKDLPKHIPQFIIVSWKCNEWGPQREIGKIMGLNFPFEKLQAMIDK